VGHPLGLSLGPRTINFRPPKPFRCLENWTIMPDNTGVYRHIVLLGGLDGIFQRNWEFSSVNFGFG